MSMTEEPLNQLFQFLRTRFRAVGDAHRTNPRRHCAAPARLSWTEGDKVRTIRVRLLDISRAGAGVITPSAPPASKSARLRLVGREPTPWVEVEVLGAEPEARGKHRIRLKFTEPCPTYFLRVAVLGPVTPDDEPGPESETTPTPLPVPQESHPVDVMVGLSSP
jgi:hypothetical protein